MLLTVDMGNTNIKIGIFDNDKLVATHKLSTRRERTEDQYAIDLGQFFASEGFKKDDIDKSIICSVVPELTETIKSAIKMKTNSIPMVVGPGIKTGINIRIDDPAQLGADLLVGAVAVANKYPSPCLVVDLGTASKISVVKNKCYCGGMISPGVKVSLNALANSASLLLSVPLDAPKKSICTNTIECMQSGIIYGTASMIDGMIERFKEELQEDVTIVATGGLSNVIIEHCKGNIIHENTLLLEGLKVIYEMNS